MLVRKLWLCGRRRAAKQRVEVPEGALTPERLASELALRLRYTPEELQALLETDALSIRFGTLVGRMLEWQRRIQFLAPFRASEMDVTKN